MSTVDWLIVTGYVLGVIAMGYFVGRRQKNQEDYYLGGRRVSPFLAGASLMANQVSAVSLIGAPAFIALRDGGGLRWLQYELAVPLAMAFIILALLPMYGMTRGVTIYEYLETRFGPAARATLSAIFLLSRSLGAGVILLATSYVTSALLGMDLTLTIVLIGFFAMAYTSLGGIMADIYSDLFQLVILWGGSLLCLVILLLNIDITAPVPLREAARFEIFRFATTGLGDGDTFSFWPMVLGGFFLYVSYYGCDQSQAQRLMATAGADGARRALLINGVMRFPLVATYCLVGFFMIPFLAQHPDFRAEALSVHPDYLVPLFIAQWVPEGARGIIVAGIIAASMSSLDSAVNSLSASTWQDFLGKLAPRLAQMRDRSQVRLSRALSVAWGCASTLFAAMMAGGSETVIELINKIGSAFYGPIAGLFLTGIMFKSVRQREALAGFVCGIGTNLFLWIFFPREISWMWWNLTGFAASVAVSVLPGILTRRPLIDQTALAALARDARARRTALTLLAWSLVITLACALAELALT